MATTGYVHGSDLLVGFVNTSDVFQPLGHCKSCTISNKSETKSRAHKEQSNSGKWDEKVVSKNSVSITAEGFVCYDSSEARGYSKLVDSWMNGEVLTVRYAYREEEDTNYFEGKFIITSLEEVGPADDDATYTLTLENSGEITQKPVKA